MHYIHKIKIRVYKTKYLDVKFIVIYKDDNYIMKLKLVSLCIDNFDYYSPTCFPLGLLNISKILKNQKVEVELFDLNKFILENEVDHNNLITYVTIELVKTLPDYIGFYTRMDILPKVLVCAKKIKKLLPNTIILLGGPGVYSIEREIMNNMPFIDLIVCGEGEKIIENLFKGGKLNTRLQDIKGIVFKQNNNVIMTEKNDPINNLDLLPIPEIVKTKIEEKEIFVPIEAGRGCPYCCNFCSTSLYWNRKYRVKSPKRLVEEIKYIINEYNCYKFTFIHDNLTVSENYIESLSKELKQNNLNIEWNCSARIDSMNENIIKLLKESGCNSIFFGIESGSEKIQKIIGKNIDLNTIIRNLELCDKYKMKTVKSFIIGFREELKEDINLTLELAIKVSNFSYNERVQINYLLPIVGTAIVKKNINELNINYRRILLLHDKRNEKLITKEEKEFISLYPKIFSSYYTLSSNIDLDSYQIAFCFSHLLAFYNKTLNIICGRYGFRPIDLFEYIVKNCDDCNSCAKNALLSTLGGKGVCSYFNKFIYEIMPNITNIEKYIIDYETLKRNEFVKEKIDKLTKNYTI